MDKCATIQIASIGLWIAVTLTILITWIVGGANYSASEDSEVGRGAALFTLTHTAYLVVLGILTVTAVGATYMRNKKCGTSSEEMLKSISFASSNGFDYPL